MQHRRRGNRRRTGSLTTKDSGSLSSSSAFKLPANFTPPMTELERRVAALQNVQVSPDVMDSSVSFLPLNATHPVSLLR